MRPNHNYIVMKPIKEKESAGGILVPSVALDPSEAQVSKAFIRPWNRVAAGRVISVGPGRHDEDEGRVVAPDVEVGQVVFYDRASATSIPWEGCEEAVMVREEGIYFAVDGDVRAVVGGFEVVER